MPEARFWAKQRVFLTGHSGFKGGWLALWLHILGAEVCGFSLPPLAAPSLFEAASVAKGSRSIFGDVRDRDALGRAVAEFEPTVVLHLAAQPLVRLSYETPTETFEVNVMGTVNMLEAVRACPSVKSALIVTSDKCYDNREVIRPYREIDPMGGRDPYSASKGCAELVTASYFWSFFVGSGCGLASVRAGNVIGGGDWSKDRLIPDLMAAFAQHRPAVIRRPDAVRPWQHVLEPLAGYLLAAEHVHGGGQSQPAAWNFGPEAGGGLPVAEVVALARTAWGADAQVETRPDPNAVHEATLLTLDATKAQRELAWRPAWDIDATVAETVSWYRRFYGGEPARGLCLDQIRRYSAARQVLLEHAP